MIVIDGRLVIRIVELVDQVGGVLEVLQIFEVFKTIVQGCERLRRQVQMLDGSLIPKFVAPMMDILGLPLKQILEVGHQKVFIYILIVGTAEWVKIGAEEACLTTLNLGVLATLSVVR